MKISINTAGRLVATSATTQQFDVSPDKAKPVALNDLVAKLVPPGKEAKFVRDTYFLGVFLNNKPLFGYDLEFGDAFPPKGKNLSL